jgi:hypothetical protein
MIESGVPHSDEEAIVLIRLPVIYRAVPAQASRSPPEPGSV